MLNLLAEFLKAVNPDSERSSCRECDYTSLQHNCMSCANDCQADCNYSCDDTDTSGLSAGICDTAGSGSSEVGCLFCYGSYSK